MKINKTITFDIDYEDMLKKSKPMDYEKSKKQA